MRKVLNFWLATLPPLLRGYRDAFVGKDLSGAFLSGARLDRVDFRRTNLQQTVFKDCRLVGAQFFRSRLSTVKLSNVEIMGYLHLILPEGRKMSRKDEERYLNAFQKQLKAGTEWIFARFDAMDGRGVLLCAVLRVTGVEGLIAFSRENFKLDYLVDAGVFADDLTRIGNSVPARAREYVNMIFSGNSEIDEEGS